LRRGARGEGMRRTEQFIETFFNKKRKKKEIG
jgi:hypothetical protein